MRYNLWKRALTLLLVPALLLCAALSVSAETESVKTPDFPALLDAAAQQRVPGVIVLSDPIYYAQSIEYFEGAYAAFAAANTGERGVIRVDGSILWQSSDPRIDSIIVYRNGLSAVYITDDANPESMGQVIFSRRGKRLNPEGVLVYEVFLHIDGATGEERFLKGMACSAQTGMDIGALLADTDGHCLMAERLGEVYNGALPICKNGKYALCDLSGNLLLPYVYDELAFVDENTLLAKQNGAYRLIDRRGNTVKELSGVTEASSLAPNSARVIICKNGLFGVCDEKGILTLECKYQVLNTMFWNNWAELNRQYYQGVLNGRSYFFSEDGKVSMDLGPYNGFGYYGMKYLADDLWLYQGRLLNNSGETRLDDIACVTCKYQNGRLLIGGYDPNDKPFIQCFDEKLNQLFRVDTTEPYISTTSSALCCIANGKISFYALADGTLLNSYESSSNAVFYAVDDWGTVAPLKKGCALTDANGNLLTDAVYARGSHLADGLYLLQKDGMFHLFDCRGTELTEPFDDVGSFMARKYSAYSTHGRYGFLQYRAADEPLFADVGKGAWYAGGTDFCALTGLMNGVGGGKFEPQTEMTRAMLVRVLYNLSGSKTESFGFSDVPAGKWYTNAVNWAAANGIVNGMGDNRFAPDEPVTREQLVTILYRYAQSFGAQAGAEDALAQFSDAGSVSGYAKDAMRWAVQAGIVNGVTKTELSPQGTATRAQIAVILERFVRLTAE